MSGLTRLHPLTRVVLVAALVSTLGVNLAMIVLFSTSRNETALKYPVIYARLAQNDDSWAFMEPAFLYTRTPDRGPLYASLFFGTEQFKFLYPPSSLLVYWVLYAEPIRTELGAFGFEPTDVLKAANYVLIPALLPLIAWLYLRSPDARELQLSRVDVGITIACLFVLLATFRPVMRGLELGQIQVWITFGLVTMFVLWIRERKGWCGVIAGLICLIKPQYGLILIWSLLRRELRFSAAMIVTGLVGLSLSLLVFGVRDHFDYVKLLSFLSQRGEAYFPNQTPNGLMNRLLLNGNMMAFTTEYPPYHPLVHATTLICQVIAMSWALVAGARIVRGDRIFDLSIFILALTLSSPLAWEHHYAFILGVFALLTVRLVSRVTSASVWALLLVSYVLASNDFEQLNVLANTPWNVLISYLLFAGIILLMLMYHVAEKADVHPWRSAIEVLTRSSTASRDLAGRTRATSR